MGVGTMTQAILGAQGSGKSTILQGLVFALPLLRPDVVPIYADIAYLIHDGLSVKDVVADEVRK